MAAGAAFPPTTGASQDVIVRVHFEPLDPMIVSCRMSGSAADVGAERMTPEQTTTSVRSRTRRWWAFMSLYQSTGSVQQDNSNNANPIALLKSKQVDTGSRAHPAVVPPIPTERMPASSHVLFHQVPHHSPLHIEDIHARGAIHGKLADERRLTTSRIECPQLKSGRRGLVIPR